jgi:hypothetical protein
MVESIRHIQLLHRTRVLRKYKTGAGTVPVFLQEAQASARTRGVGVCEAVSVLLWVCLEATNALLVISWYNLQEPAFITAGMALTLKITNMVLIVLFVLTVATWILYRSRAEFTALLYIHVLLAIAMFGINLMLIRYEKFDNGLSAIEQSALVFFSIWRLWSARMYEVGRAHGGRSSGSGSASNQDYPMESFRMLWICRNSSLVVGVLDDLKEVFSGLEKSVLGSDTGTVGTAAFRQLEFTVWCTDKDEAAVARLKAYIRGTRFESMVRFTRPELTEELVDSMRKIISGPSFMNRLRGESQTCAVTFCGSPELSQTMFSAVQMCSSLAAAVGASDFKWTFKWAAHAPGPHPAFLRPRLGARH